MRCAFVSFTSFIAIHQKEKPTCHEMLAGGFGKTDLWLRYDDTSISFAPADVMLQQPMQRIPIAELRNIEVILPSYRRNLRIVRLCRTSSAVFAELLCLRFHSFAKGFKTNLLPPATPRAEVFRALGKNSRQLHWL